MVVSEEFQKNGIRYQKFYSDKNRMIRREGLDHLFSSVICLYGEHVYQETDIPVPPITDPDQIPDTQALRIITGSEAV